MYLIRSFRYENRMKIPMKIEYLLPVREDLIECIDSTQYLQCTYCQLHGYHVVEWEELCYIAYEKILINTILVIGWHIYKYLHHRGISILN